MKIIVSIKQVPDTSGKVAVNPDGTLNRASMQTITNPDDMNALEAALKIKDATGSPSVSISVLKLEVFSISNKSPSLYSPHSTWPNFLLSEAFIFLGSHPPDSDF